MSVIVSRCLEIDYIAIVRHAKLKASTAHRLDNKTVKYNILHLVAFDARAVSDLFLTLSCKV